MQLVLDLHGPQKHLYRYLKPCCTVRYTSNHQIARKFSRRGRTPLRNERQPLPCVLSPINLGEIKRQGEREGGKGSAAPRPPAVPPCRAPRAARRGRRGCGRRGARAPCAARWGSAPASSRRRPTSSPARRRRRGTGTAPAQWPRGAARRACHPANGKRRLAGPAHPLRACH